MFGALLLVLAADDAMMLHEGWGPSVGVPEVVFFSAYATAAGSLALYSVWRMRNGATVAILIGGAALATSLVIDVVFQYEYLLEDDFKLIGALVLATVGPLVVGSGEWLPTSTQARRTAERR